MSTSSDPSLLRPVRNCHPLSVLVHMHKGRSLSSAHGALAASCCTSPPAPRRQSLVPSAFPGITNLPGNALPAPASLKSLSQLANHPEGQACSRAFPVTGMVPQLLMRRSEFSSVSFHTDSDRQQEPSINVC